MKRIALLFVLASLTLPAFAQNAEPGISRGAQSISRSVLLNDPDRAVPLLNLEKLKVASVHFLADHAPVFDSIANKYVKVTGFSADTIRSAKALEVLHDRLKLFNTIIVRMRPQDLASSSIRAFLKDLEEKTLVINIVYGPGGGVSYPDELESPLIYNSLANSFSTSETAQVVFGGVSITGKLTSDLGARFKRGEGAERAKVRLSYPAVAAGRHQESMVRRIDSVVREGIKAHSAPAVVILVAQRGEVIFNKAYGRHKYEGGPSTGINDIFDLASVTKVTATTPSVMALYDRGRLKLDDPVSKFVARTRSIPDKSTQTIREALLHEAGYFPYIKHFEKLKPGDMSSDSSAAYPTKVADNYFLRAGYFEEVMWPSTLASPVETRGKFVYSDISMYMLKEVIEQAARKSLDEFVFEEFYSPLGMQTTGYQPRRRFDRARIVPTTENDNWFRNMLVQGYVNDPGAAMAGGVQGHAGLFSNANDLAIYYQMLLNRGEYGGRVYFKPETVDLFTSRQSKVSERGLGFARATERELNLGKAYPSPRAFGHSGYTGTYVWVDPEFDLVFICLTNRVYPDDNKTYGVSKVNLRARALEIVYESLTGK